MKNWQASMLIALGLMSAPVVGETAIHRKACETPSQGVSVCWDALSEENVTELPVPYPKLHLLPIARQVAGQPEVLVDFSRTIFRQLLPGQLAEQLIPEWSPVYHLEGALAMSQSSGWPALLWISPREMRSSSPSSPGLFDMDAYLISKGKLLRTVRIRVESQPNRKHDGVERAAVAGTLLAATGSLVSEPLGSLVGIGTAYGMGQSQPPEAGQPLELLSEFAMRQLMFVFQQPMEYLPSAPTETGGDPWSRENVSNLIKRPFAGK
ncbi:hypothetical protein SIID45300_03117 [Candidatus Magnetaquicoccaceae bacterium FCR-1]|uniref:Secreted protein n=1 Tax=Candidatus Magnetaquiglobus chichijimensis TaxID=3141448 RepID=A0ABQ0CDI7_9PROT